MQFGMFGQENIDPSTIPQGSTLTPAPQFSLMPGRRKRVRPHTEGMTPGVTQAVSPDSTEQPRDMMPGGGGSFPDIFHAYGIKDPSESEKGIGGFLKGFAQVGIPAFLSGSGSYARGEGFGAGLGPGALQGLGMREQEQQQREEQANQLKQKLFEKPEFMQAYTNARFDPQVQAMIKQGITPADMVQKHLSSILEQKSLADMYGSSVEGMMANPKIPEDIKSKMWQREVALRSIPQTTYTMGAPTGLAGIGERALQGLGVNLPREPSVTYRTTGAPPEMGPSPKTSQKPKTGKKPEGFKWR